jgi:hypothetical protein
LATVAAVVVVAVVGRLRRTFLFRITIVAVALVDVGNALAEVVTALVVMLMTLAIVSTVVVDIVRRFAVTASLLLAETPVVAFVA